MTAHSSPGVGGSSVFPARRRYLQGPLHPPYRSPPTSSSRLYEDEGEGAFSRSSMPASASDDQAMVASVFLPATSTRKRSHFVAASSPRSEIPPSQSTGDLSQRPIHTSASSVSTIRRPAQFTFSDPITSDPVSAPRGEFSFQAQAPSVTINKDGSTSLHPGLESSSMAFAKLAQAQRAQQEAQRSAASGSLSHAEYSEGPAAKKRRGMASRIVDGALSAAIYTGAAAVTAYSLWSSWGRGAEEREAASALEDTSAKELLPPGGLEEPPPPYVDPQTSALRTAKTAQSPARPTHVFVSSRRRRPAFQSHRSLRTGTPKKPSSGAPSTASPQIASPSLDRVSLLYGGDDEVMEEEDELFARMQSKMTSLIEEGNRALHSQVNLEEEDLHERSALTPSKSEPLGWRAADVSSDVRAAQADRRTISHAYPSTSSSAQQDFTFNIDVPSFPDSPRHHSNHHLVPQALTQLSPYSRIPRLGTPTSPIARRRLH